MNGFEKTLRWLSRAFMVVLILILAVKLVATFVPFPQSWEYGGGTGGSTPATLALACDDVGGELTEAVTAYGASSTCTKADGYSISCEWDLHSCKVSCSDTMTMGEQASMTGGIGASPNCVAVRSMSEVPLVSSAEIPPGVRDVAGNADR